MSVSCVGDLITLHSENPDKWIIDKVSFNINHYLSSVLFNGGLEKIDQVGPACGICVNLYSAQIHTRIYMKYSSFDKAKADYDFLMEVLGTEL